MNPTLSLNTNPLVNRVAEPEALIETIARDVGLRDVQLVHEFIDPDWPAPLVRALIRRARAALERTGTRITSGMTGPYGRRNHFGHPEPGARRASIDWFRTFADTLAELGARSMGSQLAILTWADHDDPGRREAAIDRAIHCWGEVAEHARGAGLEFLFWEPMSVGRELGHTIESALALQSRIDAAALALPMLMMADVDHGDTSSANPDDTDPYAWARATARVSPIVHVKQSSTDKGGHRPFTAVHNEGGRVQPEPLLAALAEGGARDVELCLELSWREREPADRMVVAELAESVAFWAPHVDVGARGPRA